MHFRLLTAAAVLFTAVEADIVKALPHFQGQLPFELYAGYITRGMGGSAYYWYVPAETKTDNVIFTFSFQSGLLDATAGTGPIRVTRPANASGPYKVTANPFRLSTVAHTVYVDVPLGVGFSAPVKKPAPSNDFAATSVNAFITSFLDAKILKTDAPVVYVAGNLMDGNYIPLARNKQFANPSGTFRYEGILLSSPLVPSPKYLPYVLASRVVSTLGLDDYIRCSDEIYSWIVGVPPADTNNCAGVLRVVAGMGPLLLNSYTDACVAGAAPAPDGTYDPCWQVAAEAYLNLLEVQTAIHVRDAPVLMSFGGSDFYIHLSPADRLGDLAVHLPPSDMSRTLVIAGDAGVVSPATDVVNVLMETFGVLDAAFNSTQWLPWYANTNNCQVAGYASLLHRQATVATIRFAGSRPAFEQPARMKIAIERFLAGDATIGGVIPPTVPTECGPAHRWPEAAAAAALPLRTGVSRVELSSRDAAAAVGRDGHTAITLPRDSPRIANAQYTGHIHVGGTAKKDARHMFYWLIEADKSVPQPAPLMLWLQGGPGCSGLYGMFTEVGPLEAVDSGKRLSERYAAWTKLGHVLLVESPVCVGFSYVDGDQRLCENLNDTITIDDNYGFVRGFLDSFPSLRASDLYITGESYGGHYIPQLAHRIVTENAKPAVTPKIRFGGLAAGNPLTLMEDTLLDVHRWVGTPTISPQLAKAILANCTPYMLTGFQLGPCNGGTCTEEDKQRYGISDDCWDSVQWATPRVGQPGNINFASPTTDVCPVTTPDYQLTARTPYQPCGHRDCALYLNRKDVQAAIGVTRVVRDLNITWDVCSDPVNLGWLIEDATLDMIPLYADIIRAPAPAPGFPIPRVLVYSGDVDDIISLLSTQTWYLTIAKKPTVSPYFLDTNGNQLGGWKITANEGRYLFASVRGAGHEVPAYQPERMIHLLEWFFAGHMESAADGVRGLN